MQESVQQHPQHQRRKDIIKQYFTLKQTNETEDGVLQDSLDTDDLEKLKEQIQMCKYLQNQNYSSLFINQIVVNESIFCAYNSLRKAQFLCCKKHCRKHAIICGDQSCKCASDHQTCTFTPINHFIEIIAAKMSQPLPKQIRLYFQAKSTIYDYMVNRISQERQALSEWQQDIDTESEKSLFLYGFSREQAVICHDPKVKYQKGSSDHQSCGCFALIKSEIQQPDQKQAIKGICNRIHKKYCSIINYFDQKIDRLQYHMVCMNLNSYQFLFVDFLKTKNNPLSKQQPQKMKVVPGNVIYKARKNSDKTWNFIDFEKIAINKIREIWKYHAEHIFRLTVEGQTINQLFNTRQFVQAQPVQQLKKNIDKILQTLDQVQKQLFILKKTKEFRNIEPKQLKKSLQKYEGVEVNQVFICNDRCSTAIQDISTVEKLGSLKKVTKLQIKWCSRTKAQILLQILQKMPHLKHLALLGYYNRLSQKFMKKLCQFKHLKSFYINHLSHPDYFRSFSEDEIFINFNSLKKNNLPLIDELLELSKLPKLENIEIACPENPLSVLIIQRMQALKHFTLGGGFMQEDEANSLLMKELCNRKSLKTLSLVGVVVEKKIIELIITNNPYLSTIIIKICYLNKNVNNKTINDKTIECMANLIQLQTLCVSVNNLITGEHLSKLEYLKMLELTECDEIDQHILKKALKKMSKLKHLKLNNVAKRYIMSVQQCKQLEYLSIQRTWIFDSDLFYLRNLTNLKIFLCGSTYTTGRSLVKLTSRMPHLARLSIEKVKVSNQELLEISENCEALTHINIRDTNITAKILFAIKQLKVVQGFFTMNQRKELSQIGIKCQ